MQQDGSARKDFPSPYTQKPTLWARQCQKPLTRSRSLGKQDHRLQRKPENGKIQKKGAPNIDRSC
jgi:hypothetical protein